MLADRRGLLGRPADALARARTDVRVGALALLVIVACSVLIVLMAADRPSILSPTTHASFFPAWMAGPLGGLWPGLTRNSSTLKYLFSGAIVLMYAAYLVGLAYLPRLRARWTIAGIVAVHAIFFLAPPLALTDVFNYINYGRMEVVHHLNPYTSIPILEPHSDPSYVLSNWHQLLSPYGPLFTILTFAVVPIGVAASFWVIKGVLAVASLATIFLVWKCAELLGRDPVAAIVLVGLNPIVLVWGLGGDHNDFLMVFLIVLGFYLMLRARAAGAEEKASPQLPPPASRHRAPARMVLPAGRRGHRSRGRVRDCGRDQGLGSGSDTGGARGSAESPEASARGRAGHGRRVPDRGRSQPGGLRPAHTRPQHPEPAGDQRERAQPDRTGARQGR